MLTFPQLALSLALLGVPLLWGIFRLLRWSTLALRGRLALWLVAVTVFAMALAEYPDWAGRMGLSAPTWLTLVRSAIAAVAMLAIWPAARAVQRRLGPPVEQSAMFKKIVCLPLAYRWFIAVTAGVTEEVLYRGYAIGIGQTILGGTPVAFALALAIFVALHFQWGVSHLLSVLWAGAVLSVLFVVTNDLIACIAAHIFVDVIGVVIAPWAMAKSSRLGTPRPPDP